MSNQRERYRVTVKAFNSTENDYQTGEVTFNVYSNEGGDWSADIDETEDAFDISPMKAWNAESAIYEALKNAIYEAQGYSRLKEAVEEIEAEHAVAKEAKL